MNAVRRYSLAVAAGLIAVFAASPPAFAQLPAPAGAPAQPQPLDIQALERGKDALNQQKYADAAKAFEELIKAYPQSPAVPEAVFRLGYAYYLGGDYDKSVENFQKVPTTKGAPAEIIELSMSLTPQVLAAKASKLDPKDPLRDKSLADAIAQFDAFVQKFPKSDEVESANYGKALAYFQLQKYDDAAKPLRLNLQSYPQSETIQDSQFTLALVLGTEGVTNLQKDANDPIGMAKFDEAEKLLRDIVNKRLNVAMVNDAQFQLGEMLSARASFTDAEKKEQRAAIFNKALDAYRGVLSKEQVVAAQKARVDNIGVRRIEAGKQQNIPMFKKLQRLQEKEMEKLAGFEQRGDETLNAKLKNGQIFFQLNKLDEARVLLSWIEPYLENPDLKKETLYFITMSYALQSVMDKAEERYKAFQAAYKADPIAQNLQLVMAAGYLGKDPKKQNPEKAIEYCRAGLEIYPKGRFASDLLNVQAGALLGLKRYDEAEKMLRAFVASNPPKELAADADSNLAILLKDTGKIAESIKAFRDVREKYAGSKQAEQAWYWVAQLTLDSGDAKAAIPELKGFIGKYPSSELLPQAKFALGRAESSTNQADAALATFAELQKTFPKSEVAPFTFFERAKIMNGRQAYDECLAIMKSFISEYPDSPSLYQAYDFMAQIMGAQSKGMEAVELYNEYLSKRPSEPGSADALLKLNSLWKGYAEAQGPFLAQDEKKRAEWTKGLDNSSAAGEQILDKFPDSANVALALNNLLDVQKSKLRAHLVTEADIEKYFEGLAAKAEGKAGAQSKIRFTLAGFLSPKDKDKAVAMMSGAYKSELKYAPDDVDLYGKTLLASKDYDKALEVYGKLAKDYPIPPGVEPKKAARSIQEAQAIALAGEGNALLGKKQNEEAGKRFKEVEENYAWTPKMMEVNYGIAQDLHDKKQDDEALTRLLAVVKNSNATSQLRANSMLLLGKIHEEAGRFDAAIDNFIKIGTFYQGVPEAAAEGLWRGAQLLERQARGEIPMPPPPTKTTPAPKVPKATPAKEAAAPEPEKKG